MYLGAILVVRVRVDDRVRSEPEARLDTDHEGDRKTVSSAETDDVVHAVSLGHLYGVVGAPIIDDEPFHDVISRHFLGRSASVIGKASASLRQGICMMSFLGRRGGHADRVFENNGAHP